MKYILLSLFFTYSYQLIAQVDSLYSWKFQFVLGNALPLHIKNDQKTSLNSGSSGEISINYIFSEKYFSSIKLNYTKHILSDENVPLVYPVIRTHYIAPMVGMFQNRNKFYFEEKIGFGMLYARQSAYLVENEGPLFVTKSADESYSFITEFNFSCAYQFNQHLSLVFNTGVKFSEMNWDIHYFHLEQVGDRIKVLFYETFNERIVYLPIALTVGVSYKL